MVEGFEGGKQDAGALGVVGVVFLVLDLPGVVEAVDHDREALVIVFPALTEAFGFGVVLEVGKAEAGFEFSFLPGPNLADDLTRDLTNGAVP